MTNRQTITLLTEQLEQLRIATENIQNTIKRLQEKEDQGQEHPTPRQTRGAPTDPEVRDRDHRTIHYDDTVVFLTRGLYNSTTGRVFKVSTSGNRITARDKQGRSISRNRRNVRIIQT